MVAFAYSAQNQRSVIKLAIVARDLVERFRLDSRDEVLRYPGGRCSRDGQAGARAVARLDEARRQGDESRRAVDFFHRARPRRGRQELREFGRSRRL